MAGFLTKIFMRFHTWLYEISNGKFGANLVGIPILILYVVGRKSGKSYKIPLAYHPEADEYIVVASNNALPTNPGWYYNVLADDNASARVGDTYTQVTAREVIDDEREQIWQQAIQTNSAWDGYRQRTDRQIPVIALKPVAS